MQISNIESFNTEQNIITVNGNQVLVPKSFATEAQIISYLAEPHWEAQDWETNATEIESINNGTASQAIIDKHIPGIPPQTVNDITEVTNGVLKVNTSVQAQNFYTESKVIDSTKKYTDLFVKSKLDSKANHKNAFIVNGEPVLDMEARIVDLEGAMMQLLNKKDQPLAGMVVGDGYGSSQIVCPSSNVPMAGMFLIVIVLLVIIFYKKK
jgi:hypothetical protein